MTDLQTACAALEQIAPTGLAGSWDNVGLLVEGTRQVERIGLCIDLTEPVLMKPPTRTSTSSSATTRPSSAA